MAMSRISAVFDADTAGLTAGSKAAAAAFRSLSGDIASLDSTFRRLDGFAQQGFSGIGPAADAAREATTRLFSQASLLNLEWQNGALTIGQYRAALDGLAVEAARVADLASRGAAIERRFATPESTVMAALSEYNELLEAGVLSAGAHARAVAEATATLTQSSVVTDALAQSARERAAMEQRAQQVIRGSLSAEQQYAAAIRELDDLRTEGLLTTQQYAAAVAQADERLRETSGAARAAAEAERARNAVLQQGAQVTRQVATAQEAYRERVSELRGLLQAGAITQRAFGRAVDAARKEMREAGNAATEYRSKASGLNAVLGRLNTIIALQATQLFIQLTSAISQAVRGIVNMGNQSREAIDKIDLLAKRTGQSRQALASLEFVGRQAGVGIEQLATATARADRLFVQAQNGSKQAANSFKAIGLSVEELAGLSPEDRFNAIAEAIAQLPTQAQQSAAAIAIFGRAGAELVPMFQDMQGQMAAAREQAERLGLVLTDQQVAGVDAMNDSLDVAYAAFEGIVRQVTAELAPAIKAVADLWTGFVAATGGANIGAGVVSLLLDGAELVARIFDYAVAVFTPVWDYAKAVVNELGGVANVWQGVMVLFQSITFAFQGVLQGLVSVGSAVASGIYKVMKYVFDGAAFVAKRLGYDELSKSLEGMAAASDQFSAQAYENMIQAGTAAGENFTAAVDTFWKPEDYGFRRGDAAAGTLENGIEEFRNRLRPGQAEAGEAVKKAGDGVAAGVAVAVSEKLAGALDARSKEGNAELLRLMYGSNVNRVAEKQLQVQEQIAEGIDELNGNIDNLGMEAFAF
jgi:hypothetical protein